MKKVLVIGGGGRCHAIADALARSPKVDKIYCAPGNAGIEAQAECVPLPVSDVEGLKEFALANGIDLTVVGPEASLAVGIVDEFRLPAHIGVPLGKVHLHIGDLLHLLLVVLCHMSLHPFR